MTLTEFARLDKTQQLKWFRNGMLIGQRFAGKSLIECRQVDGFYLEYKIPEKRLPSLRGFQNPDLLQPYLNEIDIEALLD